MDFPTQTRAPPALSLSAILQPPGDQATSGAADSPSASSPEPAEGPEVSLHDRMPFTTLGMSHAGLRGSPLGGNGHRANMYGPCSAAAAASLMLYGSSTPGGGAGGGAAAVGANASSLTVGPDNGCILYFSHMQEDCVSDCTSAEDLGALYCTTAEWGL